MEYPWPNLDSQSSISSDLTKLRISAAMALKKIESAYEDIMGCNKFCEDDEISIEGLGTISDNTSDNSARENTSDIFTPKQHYRIMENPKVFRRFESSKPNLGKTCSLCHKILDPEKRLPQQFPCIPWNVEVSITPPKPVPFSCEHCATPPECTPFSCERCIKEEDRHPTNEYENGVVEHPHESPTQMSNKRHSAAGLSDCPLKVTVPEPFQMTLRDENQRVIKELKIERLKKQMKDEKEKELKTTFYSNPAPQHTFLPLYQNLVKSEEKRKQERRKAAKEVKEAMKADNTKNNQRALCRKNTISNLPKAENSFRAKPVPKHILSNKVSEKLRTKEMIRKLKISQRAQETLQESALPFTSRNIRRTCSAMSLFETAELSHTKSAKPTFSQTECQDALRKWNAQICEVISSQNVTTTVSSDEIAKQKYQSRYDEFLSLQAMPFCDVPVRKTSASMMREKEIRHKLTQKEYNNDSCLQTPGQYSKEVKDKLLSQLKLNDLTKNSKKELENKLKSYRASHKLRQQEYEKELNEMNLRVGKKPLLIEREALNNKTPKNVSSVSENVKSVEQVSSNEEHHATISSNDEESRHTASDSCGESNQSDDEHKLSS